MFHFRKTKERRLGSQEPANTVPKSTEKQLSKRLNQARSSLLGHLLLLSGRKATHVVVIVVVSTLLEEGKHALHYRAPFVALLMEC